MAQKSNGWGVYERILDSNTHLIGKKNTQKIESKHLIPKLKMA
ncbi:IS1 family transposase [Pseudanabaena catenata USMAC16]|uniref:IS1 family transposase n=1 Tax=Pseudanabaena catenata USMAC16 TaxID=1855837 RepID=A0A9X4RHY3_9CYAN|nr:IS1 family transposase [Pseudanabaena catenata]MDG3494490.1 IS1 family transposase [Pseudanabaena catenata USMAC16]